MSRDIINFMATLDSESRREHPFSSSKKTPGIMELVDPSGEFATATGLNIKMLTRLGVKFKEVLDHKKNPETPQPLPNAILEIPMTCPKPPLKNYFSQPIYVPNRETPEIEKVPNSPTSIPDIAQKYFDKITLTPEDFLKNTSAQTTAARALGVLGETETWEDYLKSDRIIPLPDDQLDRFKVVTSKNPGKSIGVYKTITGSENPNITPEQILAPTKYDNVDLLVMFYKEDDGDMRLDEAITHGYATPHLSLVTSTDHLTSLLEYSGFLNE